MITALVIPAIGALVASLAAGLLQRRLPPRLGVRVLTIVLATSAIAAAGALATLVIGTLAQIPWVADHAGWCRRLAHDAVPPVGGLASGVGLTVMTAAAWRARQRAKAVHAGQPDTGALTVLPIEAAVAYAVPGRRERVVVSSGMLSSLDPSERRVLFAHEHAHLRLGHHRYLRIGEVAAAAVPLLRPLLARLRFATERWADEEAAIEIGDRRLVARALVRAALAQGRAVSPQPAMASLGVPGRVEALLAGPAVRPWLLDLLVVGVVGIGAAAVISSGVQLHHLLSFAAHVCPL